MHPFRIYSVPHTGTRFVQSFFNYQGFAPDLCHAGQSITDNLLLVIPQRHPYECYQSHCQKSGFDFARFIGWWHELIFRAENSESFLFPIEEKSEATERKACEFVDIPYAKGFPWVRVGASDREREAKDYLSVARHLQFAVDWYGNQ